LQGVFFFMRAGQLNLTKPAEDTTGFLRTCIFSIRAASWDQKLGV
jgi:hypothetical protein